jgi:hypothetical protein
VNTAAPSETAISAASCASGRYDAFVARDPSFKPAFPVAHNPTMRPPLDPHNRITSSARGGARLDFANSLYGHMLRCLVQAWPQRRQAASGCSWTRPST